MSTQDDKEESFPCNLNQTEDSGLVSYCVQDKAEKTILIAVGSIYGMYQNRDLRGISKYGDED